MLTIFKNIHKTNEPHRIRLASALLRIKIGQSKELIESIRKETDRKNRNALKIQLPCIMFSGEFNKRSIDGMKSHSGLISMDFDHLDTLEERADKTTQLMQDKCIYAIWVSPSGNGIKALMKTAATSAEDHYEYWEAIYEKYPDMDKACKDPSRVTYESYDPDIYVNKEAEIWTKRKKKESPLGRVSPMISNAPEHATATNYSIMQRAVDMIANAPDDEKHFTLVKAANLAGGFVAGGQVIESDAEMLLWNEISKRKIDDERKTMNTIRDGIENGKLYPLYPDTEYTLPPPPKRPPTTEEADEIFNTYDEYRIGDETEIEEPVPLLTVNGELVLSEGEILTLSGIMKAGKSAVTSAIISKMFNPNGKGFANIVATSPEKPILHFDTEQPLHRHRKNQVDAILARAEMEQLPDNYFSYNLRRMPMKDRQEMVANLLGACMFKYGSVGLVVIDGIADFIDDVNDAKHSVALIDWLLQMASEFKCGIIPVIHINPNSGKEGYQVKQRGHLGSELQRRTDSMLVVDWEDKENELSKLYAQFLRGGSVKNFGSHLISWDSQTGMHQLVDGQVRQESIKNNKIERRIQLIIGKDKQAATREIMEDEGVEPVTAKRTIKDLLDLGFVIEKDGVIMKRGLIAMSEAEQMAEVIGYSSETDEEDTPF